MVHSAEDPSITSDSEEPESEAAAAGSSLLRSLLEWVVIIVIALGAFLVMRYFVVQSFWIPSSSMEQTLQLNDRVMVNRLSYRFGDISRGDVVVFTPDPQSGSPYGHLIKRVVALEGDVVQGQSGVLWVNGEAVEEPYLADGMVTSDFGPLTVPDDSLYVLGDNRTHSGDSRIFGPIQESSVIGRAFVRFWPPSRVGGL